MNSFTEKSLLKTLTISAASVLAFAQNTQNTPTIDIEFNTKSALIAYITITNTSNKTIFIEKIKNNEDSLAQEFKITCDNNIIEYIGPLASHSPLTKMDFIPLNPGKSHHRNIRLDNLYDFPKSWNKCVVIFYCLTFETSTSKIEPHPSKSFTLNR